MSQDRTYYRAEGRTLENVKKWQEAEASANKEAWAIARRIGAKGINVYTGSYGIAGFFFDEPPKGWREMRDGDYLPKKNSKAGRALYEEIKKIHGKNLDYLLGADDLMIDGRYIRHCTLEKLGESLIVSVPHNSSGNPFFIPEDAVPLKMSEYWALKEAEDKA